MNIYSDVPVGPQWTGMVVIDDGEEFVLLDAAQLEVVIDQLTHYQWLWQQQNAPATLV